MNIIVFDLGVTQPKDKGILLKDIIENATADKDKSYCLDANYWKGCSKEYSDLKGRRQLVCTGGAFRGRNPENTSDRTPGSPTEQRLEINETGKSNCLTSVSKDSILAYTKNYIQYDSSGKGYKSQDSRIFYKDNKSNCLSVAHSSIPSLKETETETEILWRKLTPIECERLQTVPDNYTNHVSNSRRYHALGNGWTVDIIAHIFRYIK